MSDDPDKKYEELSREVAARERRKIRARREKDESIWFGLGMIGLVGWSVAIPILVSVLIGFWIDRTYPSRYSWTLMFLFIGVVLGALNAWYWVSRERQAIEKPEFKEDDHQRRE